MLPLTQRGFAVILLLFALSVAGFAILRLMPGDFATVLLTAQSDGVLPSAAEVAAFSAANGLDAPLPLQYLRWLLAFLSGDMGTSFSQGRPVAEMLAQSASNSALLTLTVITSAFLIALPAAIFAALRPNGIIDRIVMLFAVTGMALPTFWFALLASLLFVLHLRWLPSSGFETALHIVLPTIVAATGIAGFLARYLRSLLLDESQKPYILNARAQGASALGAMLRHALPNCAPAIVTLLGLQIIHVFEGMLVIETIFNWPGMGRLFVNALMARDFPVIQACFLTIGTSYILLNLGVDLILGWLDRHGARAI